METSLGTCPADIVGSRRFVGELEGWQRCAGHYSLACGECHEEQGQREGKGWAMVNNTMRYDASLAILLVVLYICI